MHHAQHVQLEHSLPGLVAEFVKRAIGDRTARIADQYIKTPEPFLRYGHAARNACRIRDIHDQGHGIAASRNNLVFHAAAAVRGPRGNQDCRALCCQAKGYGLANPLVAARD